MSVGTEICGSLCVIGDRNTRGLVCQWRSKYVGAGVSMGTDTPGRTYDSEDRNMWGLVCQWGPKYLGDGVTAGTEICGIRCVIGD